MHQCFIFFSSQGSKQGSRVLFLNWSIDICFENLTAAVTKWGKIEGAQGCWLPVRCWINHCRTREQERTRRNFEIRSIIRLTGRSAGRSALVHRQILLFLEYKERKSQRWHSSTIHLCPVFYLFLSSSLHTPFFLLSFHPFIRNRI